MKIIAVTSGKGGVGKTNISANLAIALSQLKQRVVVLDGDIGLANLDLVLGCRVQRTLQDAIGGRCTLAEVIQSGPGGIRFIPGGSGIEQIFHLSRPQADRLVSELMLIARETDFLILDTGAGLDDNVLTFLEAADETFIVVTPDPASVSDGYATAKAMVSNDPGCSVKLLINQVSNERDATQIYSHINGVATRFLRREIGFGGYVRLDLQALDHIRRRTPFLLGNPKSPASVDVRRIAQGMVGAKAEPVSADLRTRLRALFALPNRRIA